MPLNKEKVEGHQLFQLTAANNGSLPMSIYAELYLDILGIMVLKVGVVVIQEPNELLDECQ